MMTEYQSKQLAESLWAWLNRQKKSMSWLANVTGINYSLMHRYGRGEICPTLRNCVLMANALGISLDQLYQGPQETQMNAELDEARKQLEEIMEKMQRLLRRMESEHAEA